MVAGVLGLLPDDRRLFRSFELAEEAGVEVGFSFTEIVESKHPNAIKFVLTGQSGLMVELVGDSTGGGMVETVSVDGFPLRTIGDAFVLLVAGPAGGAERRAASSGSGPGCRDVVDAQEVRVAGRGVLYAFELPVEPDLAARPGGARRRRRRSCAWRCCGRCCRSSADRTASRSSSTR